MLELLKCTRGIRWNEPTVTSPSWSHANDITRLSYLIKSGALATVDEGVSSSTWWNSQTLTQHPLGSGGMLAYSSNGDTLELAFLNIFFWIYLNRLFWTGTVGLTSPSNWLLIVLLNNSSVENCLQSSNPFEPKPTFMKMHTSCFSENLNFSIQTMITLGNGQRPWRT